MQADSTLLTHWFLPLCQAFGCFLSVYHLKDLLHCSRLFRWWLPNMPTSSGLGLQALLIDGSSFALGDGGYVLHQCSSSIFISFIILLNISLHLSLGPPHGCGWWSGGHPCNMPSPYSRQHFFTFTVAARSPCLLLTLYDVMCCTHCCLLVMPRIVPTHLLWNKPNFISCFFFSSVQHSDPYNSTDWIGTLLFGNYLYIPFQKDWVSIFSEGIAGLNNTPVNITIHLMQQESL